MSLNSVMLESGTRHPVPLPNENFLYHCSGVKFELKHTNTGDYPGGGLSPKSASGTTFISNQRIVFLPLNTTHETSMATDGPPGTVNSFTVPHVNLRNLEFAQPIFGANRFEALVQPVAGGGVAAGSTLVLTFKEGGGFDFAAIARKMSDRIQETGEVPPYEEELPEYDGPPPQLPTAEPTAAAHTHPGNSLPKYPTDAPPGYE
ncbi:hypothetical protein LPJ73_001506 [Coemansia sp. RSA 2703]|nr:hypothetical protein LPJ73_001506 [Coemansia sp. RSA 2703]KAJ2364869.1 hypothetical protein IW150_006369 [Coemansia sp. RSA 2607]